jgi:hypothetical protein
MPPLVAPLKTVRWTFCFVFYCMNPIHTFCVNSFKRGFFSNFLVTCHFLLVVILRELSESSKRVLERIIVRPQSNQESFIFFNVHQYGLIKRVIDKVRRSRSFDRRVWLRFVELRQGRAKQRKFNWWLQPKVQGNYPKIEDWWFVLAENWKPIKD